ncbi:Eco57I restriction-modification methylase domain-containing protein [Gulosibacter hominis]|uniref:Eco57I restriction-modification methylase domain-containing protein n=1 Tax=Gulosibacter hominis TaxID=2770504 RepID=UPI00191B5E87|nr:hypothetical protein [Gulosibacter hominis]
MKHEYPDSKSDLFAAFIERAVSLLKRHGYMAQVTMQSWMFLSSYERLRSKLQRDAAIVAMLHMDNMVMRIAFGTCATIWKIGGNSRLPGKYTWMELDDLAGESPRRFPARNPRNTSAGSDGFFTVSQRDMNEIPGSPIVYWLSEKMRATFSEGRPLSEVANLKQGLATADNNRFLRLWWEVSEQRTSFSCTSREEAATSGARWFPYNKGGEFRKWYGNQEYVVNWENDGAEIRVFGAENGGRPRSRAQNIDTYFSPSVSWSDISSGEAAFRRFPAGFIHDSTGHSGFADPTLLKHVILLLNSRFVMETMKVVAPTLHFHIGYVGLVPVFPGVLELPSGILDALTDTSRDDWDCFETSWNFRQNPLLDSA